MNNFTGRLKSHYFPYSNESLVRLLRTFTVGMRLERRKGLVTMFNSEMRLNYRWQKIFSSNQCLVKLLFLLFMLKLHWIILFITSSENISSPCSMKYGWNSSVSLFPGIQPPACREMFFPAEILQKNRGMKSILFLYLQMQRLGGLIHGKRCYSCIWFWIAYNIIITFRCNRNWVIYFNKRLNIVWIFKTNHHHAPTMIKCFSHFIYSQNFHLSFFFLLMC